MNHRKKRIKLFQKLAIALALVAITAMVIFVSYFLYSATYPLPASQDDFDKTISNQQITITEDKHWFSIKPTKQSTAGLIFYPGAFTDPKAYVAVYGYLANNGVSVFILKSPFNFALLNTNQALNVMKDNPHINTWFVAGHSLGGVAACEFAKQNEAKLSGLILLASYCNGNATELRIPVLVVAGSNDGLSTLSEVRSAQTKLPSDVKLAVIDGANHSQFGAFSRLQPGDNTPEISTEQARRSITESITNFINQNLSDN